MWIKKRRIFVSRLLVGRFSKFKNLNALEFNSEHFYDANFVVKLIFLSKKGQKLQIYWGKNQLFANSVAEPKPEICTSPNLHMCNYTYVRSFGSEDSYPISRFEGVLQCSWKLAFFWVKNGHFGVKTPCHQNLAYGTWA